LEEIVPGRRSLGFAFGFWLVCAVSALLGRVALRELGAQTERIVVPATQADDAVDLSADWSQEWKSGEDYIGVFRGHCKLTQGDREWRAQQMVVWSREETHDSERVQKLTVYLEDRVVIVDGDTARQETAATAEIVSRGGVTLSVRGRQQDQPADQDALYQRAVARRRGPARGVLLPTQFTVEQDPGWQSVPLANPQQIRRVRIYQRSALPFDIDSRRLTDRTPPEQVTIITGGITILVDGITVDNIGNLGTIDLSADRAIVWTDAFGEEEFSTDLTQRADAKYQVYLEGNIVIRQGDNVVRAERAFYDARDEKALVLNADLQAFFPELGASVRVHSDRLRQYSNQFFHAQNAWFTTSPYGKPGYRIEASDVFMEQRAQNLLGGQTAPTIDPETGQVVAATQPWITAENTRFYLEDVPLFFVPYASGTPEDVTTPLQQINFRQDRIFGTQILTTWDAFSTLGIERPEGVKWFFDLNILSQRGPQIGSTGSYEGVDRWGNPFQGIGLTSYVNDVGADNLGFDRRDLIPPDPNRGRFNLRHRWWLSPDTLFQGEVGYVSDRNYLESYYEQEFDRGKDQETLGYLRHTVDNWSGSILFRPQVNPFEYNTQWLPRGDLTILGQPIFNTPLNWSMHSYVGYASLNNTQPPYNPAQDLFDPLPYYAAGDGLMASSRHEVALPFNVGELKIVPYAMGEASHWGDSFNDQSVGRLYGRTGLRASLQVWRAFPYVQSELFNLNGLAHKNVLTADYGLAGSTKSLSDISQWNEFDDDAQERFRERLLTNTFGGTLPPWFDPRNYAVRSAAATSVTAPYNELVDNQNMLALGWSQRLQTKVGPPDALRLKDWMTLDLGVNYYPAADRDNFGEDFGLFSARYAWNVGDRTTILANTLNDFFDGGQQVWNLGLLTQRSYRGSLYLGIRQIKGGTVVPNTSLDSEILTASYSYVMTPDKWVSTFFTAYDLAENRNRGQAFTFTRIGSDFLFHLGMNYDASKNNVGFTFSVEPKFGSFKSGQPQFGPMMGASQ